MSSAVQGMPRVMSDNELTTGLTKASPVVIPDKMPMTTLNLDLDWRAKKKKKMSEQSFALCGEIHMERWLLDRKHSNTLTRNNYKKTWGIFKVTGWSERVAATTVTMEREVKTCDAAFTGVSYLRRAYY